MVFVLKISYFGEHYYGVQLQNDVNTIGKEICIAIQTIGINIEDIRFLSRTDAGVSAAEQYCFIRCDRDIKKYEKNIKSILYKNTNGMIAIISIQKDCYYKRHILKEYWYSIRINREAVWDSSFYPIQFNITQQKFDSLMKIVLKLLNSGKIDYKKICCDKEKIRLTNNCPVIKIKQDNKLKTGRRIFSICGSGFFYKQARIIVGTAIKMINKLNNLNLPIPTSKESLEAMFYQCKFVAPAKFLCLMRFLGEKEVFDIL